MQLPINKNLITANSAYLGSAFTSPDERGLWVLLFSTSKIISYLKENTDIKTALLVVHSKTKGATLTFDRLGFNIIKNAAPKSLLYWFISKIRI